MPAPGFINGVDAKVHGAVAVIFAGIAQLVERRPRTAQVPGSTPGFSSTNPIGHVYVCVVQLITLLLFL